MGDERETTGGSRFADAPTAAAAGRRSPAGDNDAPGCCRVLRVVEERPGVIVACLGGALDAVAVPPVRDALLHLAHGVRSRSAAVLIIDLTAVSALDAQGARLLAALCRRAYTSGQGLHLRAPACHLRAVIGAAHTHPFLRS
jgi:anti-anti-sigma regulatory factor